MLSSPGAEGAPSRLRGMRIANLATPGWVLAVAAVTTGDPIDRLPNWLDGSWMVGLDMAGRQHLPMGSRLFFTYGPYGFLDSRVPYFAPEWLVAVVAAGLLHLALVAAVAVLLRLVRAGPLAVALVAVTAVVTLPTLATLDVEAALLLGTMGTLVVALDGRRAQLPVAAATGAVCALLLLVKVSGLVIVGGVLLVLAGMTLGRRRWRPAAAVTAGVLATFALLWWGAGLGLGALPTYVRASLEIVSGFAPAMGSGGLVVGIFVAAAVLLAFAVTALVALLQRRIVVATWLLLSLVLCLAAFKEDYVRYGAGRDTTFLGEVAFLVAVSVAVVGVGSRVRVARRHLLLPAVVFLPLLALAVGWRLTEAGYFVQVPQGMRDWVTVAHAVGDDSLRRRLEQPAREKAAEFYRPVMAAASLPAGATVDFYGGDVGYFYADQSVHWTPRPVLQSYQANTPWLDQQDAAFYSGAAAPDYVIFRLVGLDGRYAVLDEPSTFRVLMQRYRFVKVIDVITVLLRRDPAAAAPQPERSEGRACGAMGTPIPVRQVPGRLVYGRLDMAFSMAGRVLDLALKPAEARIALDTPDARFEYRLVWATGSDGIYLSALAADAGGLRDAFERRAGARPLHAVTISSSAPWEWETPVCLDFFSVAALSPLLGDTTP